MSVTPSEPKEHIPSVLHQEASGAQQVPYGSSPAPRSPRDGPLTQLTSAVWTRPLSVQHLWVVRAPHTITPWDLSCDRQ